MLAFVSWCVWLSMSFLFNLFFLSFSHWLISITLFFIISSLLLSLFSRYLTWVFIVLSYKMVIWFSLYLLVLCCGCLFSICFENVYAYLLGHIYNSCFTAFVRYVQHLLHDSITICCLFPCKLWFSSFFVYWVILGYILDVLHISLW